MEQFSDSQLDILCRLSSAASLQQIVDLGYELLGNPIFISDMSHVILAYTKSVDIPNEDWHQDVMQGRLERALLRDEEEFHNRQRDMAHIMSSKNRLPVVVNDSDRPYPRLIKVLLIDGRSMGVVVMPQLLKPIADGDIKMLELISSFVSARTHSERYMFSQNERAVENYMIKLLDGADFSSHQIKIRLDNLRWKHLPQFYVMVLRLKDPQDTEGAGVDGMLAALSAMPNCCAFFYDNSIVFLSSYKAAITEWVHETPELNEHMEQWGLAAGVSRRFQNLTELRDCYLEAANALWLAQKLDRPGTFFPYNIYSLYSLFQLSSAHLNLRDFCHEKIFDLEKYDRFNGSSLLITLQTYLEHSRSLAKTAEMLYLHRNTVMYRIKKCMEIMDTDLKNEDEVFSYLISLKILEYDTKLPKMPR